jgi:hypothetical protein
VSTTWALWQNWCPSYIAVTVLLQLLPCVRCNDTVPQMQVRFIQANWEVDVVVTDFSGWLFDTVDLMQRSDVLLGMHGAGMTNVYFLPEVSTTVASSAGFVCAIVDHGMRL